MAESRRIESAQTWLAVTVNTAVATARGVYIGISDDYDFTADGTTTWVKFTGCVAGSVLPLAATGARKNSDSSAPAAGAIVFLY